MNTRVDDSTVDIAGVLRGVRDPGSPRIQSRLDPDTIAKSPVDTVDAGRVPAGARFEFQGDASRVEFELSFGEKPMPASPTLSPIVSAWIGDRLIQSVPVTGPRASVEIDLPARDDDDIVTVYLPEVADIEIHDIRSVGGSLRPAPHGKRWVVYGDSITQGWSTTDAGLTWPSRVSRALGLDLVNLGFAGSARGELTVAFQVAATPADVITLAWGTNAWSSIPTDAPTIADTMRLFIQAIRAEQPHVPILVLSPILRPGAENEPNRFGATQVQLRAAIENRILELAQTDAALTLLPGLELVDEHLLVDGIHPGDEGHGHMALAVTDALTAILAQ